WNNITLNALGVETKPSLKRMYETITKTLEKKRIPKKYFRGLVDTFLHLVHNKREYSEDDEDYEMKFTSLAWIPTLDGELSEPDEVFWPSERNLDLLGESHPKLMDISLATPSIVDKFDIAENGGIENSGEQERTVRALGVKTAPSAEELIDVIRSCMYDETEPPASVFSEVAKSFDENKLVAEELGYFYDDEWYDSDCFVIIGSKQKVDSIISEIAIPILEEKDKNYLRCIGVTSSVMPSRVLYYLSTNQDKLMDDWSLFTELWDILEESNEELTEELKEEYSSRGIYLIGGQSVAPEDIITFDDDIGTLQIDGNTHAVSRKLINNHLMALTELGARSEKEMEENIKEVILSFSKFHKKNDIDPDYYSFFMKLLWIATKRDVFIDDLMIPVREETDDEYYVLKPTDTCYLDDDPKSLLFFDLYFDKLYILDHDFPPELHKYVLQSGVTSIKNTIKVLYTSIGSEENREYPDQQQRLRMMGAALEHKYDFNFEWLMKIEVRQTDFLEVTYILDDEEKTTSRQQAYFASGDGWPLYITFPATKEVFNHITDILYDRIYSNWQDELDDENLESIRHEIDYMLRTNPIEWKNVIEGFTPANTDILPLDIVYLENPEYRSGYAKTRQYFKAHYSGCQICGTPTPLSRDQHPETCESVNAIVSRLGGLVNDDPGDYEIGACLYLCPKHQVMLRRGLIGIPNLGHAFNFRKSRATELSRIKALRKEIEEEKSSVDLDDDDFVRVNYEIWEFDPEVSKYGDKIDEMDFTTKHYHAMFDWVERYLKTRLRRLY
ncbi:MAG: hypothetical protein ACTSWQ_10360, partial [Candidatus Thorarchaeota archaeon]